MRDEKIRAYARLTARTGANVQPGQGAVIYTQPEACGFARMVAEELYQAGAGWVQIMYQDQPAEKMAYQYEKPSVLKRVPKYIRERQRYFNRELPCEIHIVCEDPDGLDGVDRQLLAEVMQARSRVIKPLRDERENKNQWTIVAIPSPEWAAKVFPELPAGEAVDALWDAILDASRVWDTEPDKAWEKQNALLISRAKAMTAFGFESVHLESRMTGTDLTVGLIEGAQWFGGPETTLSGIVFNPNIPTEEVFTTPMKGKAEGRVVATKPLSFMGQIIDGFSLEFRGGKAVSCKAEKGEDLLEKMLRFDETASMLGEVALIGLESPINQSGLLFYETLFDENASCHLALGMGFGNVIPGFENMTREELNEKGINDSVHHTDFMIGSPDMKVTGTKKDGTQIVVFENGTWKI